MPWVKRPTRLQRIRAGEELCTSAPPSIEAMGAALARGGVRRHRRESRRPHGYHGLQRSAHTSHPLAGNLATTRREGSGQGSLVQINRQSYRGDMWRRDRELAPFMSSSLWPEAPTPDGTCSLASLPSAAAATKHGARKLPQVAAASPDQNSRRRWSCRASHASAPQGDTASSATAGTTSKASQICANRPSCRHHRSQRIPWISVRGALLAAWS